MGFTYLEIEFAARERQRESDSVRVHSALIQHLTNKNHHSINQSRFSVTHSAAGPLSVALLRTVKYFALSQETDFDQKRNLF